MRAKPKKLGEKKKLEAFCDTGHRTPPSQEPANPLPFCLI